MVVDPDYVPCRGDIVWLTLVPQAGHEQTGRRPALILTPENYNRKTSLVIACPITSRIKHYPFEVPLTDELPVEGVILTDQVKSLDWKARHAEFICQLSNEGLSEVLEKIELLLFS